MCFIEQSYKDDTKLLEIGTEADRKPAFLWVRNLEKQCLNYQDIHHKRVVLLNQQRHLAFFLLDYIYARGNYQYRKNKALLKKLDKYIDV